MRLHGKLFTDAEGTSPIILFAADMDDGDQLKPVELVVTGNQVKIRVDFPEPPSMAPDVGPDQDADPIPESRRMPITGDFDRPGNV